MSATCDLLGPLIYEFITGGLYLQRRYFILDKEKVQLNGLQLYNMSGITVEIHHVEILSHCKPLFPCPSKLIKVPGMTL